MSIVLPDGHSLDAGNTGLVVFDALERARESFEQSGALQTIQGLIERCREVGVPVLYARADNRGDGLDFEECKGDTDSRLRPWSSERPVRTQPSHGSGSPKLQVLEELAPQTGDYDIPKQRWSAFYGTPLDLYLRTRGIDTVLLVGGSTHVGIAATAYAGRDRDFHMVIVSDGCAGLEEQRTFFIERVFPRMCHVLTADDVIGALQT